MTTESYRELFELILAGAVARSEFHTDAILARPAALVKELARTLSPLEADKLIDAIEAVNTANERARERREADRPGHERDPEAVAELIEAAR